MPVLCRTRHYQYMLFQLVFCFLIFAQCRCLDQIRNTFADANPSLKDTTQQEFRGTSKDGSTPKITENHSESSPSNKVIKEFQKDKLKESQIVNTDLDDNNFSNEPEINNEEENNWYDDTIVHFDKRLTEFSGKHSFIPFGKKNSQGNSHSFIPFGKRTSYDTAQSFLPFGKRNQAYKSNLFMELDKKHESHKFLPFGKRQKMSSSTHSFIPFGKKMDTNMNNNAESQNENPITNNDMLYIKDFDSLHNSPHFEKFSQSLKDETADGKDDTESYFLPLTSYNTIYFNKELLNKNPDLKSKIPGNKSNRQQKLEITNPNTRNSNEAKQVNIKKRSLIENKLSEVISNKQTQNIKRNLLTNLPSSQKDQKCFNKNNIKEKTAQLPQKENPKSQSITDEKFKFSTRHNDHKHIQKRETEDINTSDSDAFYNPVSENLHYEKTISPFSLLKVKNNSNSRQSNNKIRDNDINMQTLFDKRFYNFMSLDKNAYSYNPFTKFGKKLDTSHSFIPFGKRSENFDTPPNDIHNDYYPEYNLVSKKADSSHSFLPFGKRMDDSHSFIPFGKRFDNSHSFIPFGKRLDDSHSFMPFGKRPDNSHSFIPFGKRLDDSHSFLPFGKRSDSSHSFIPFGKRPDNSHSFIPFGKRSDSAHSFIPFGKRSDGTHSFIPFGKRLDDTHSFIPFGKRFDNSDFFNLSEKRFEDTHSFIPFGKKSDNSHSFIPFGKKSDSSHSFIPFGKKSESSHSFIPFGKKSESSHSFIPFGKKSESSHSFIPFGKKSDSSHSFIPFGKRSDNSHFFIPFGKKYDMPSPFASNKRLEDTHSFIPFGKRYDNSYSENAHAFMPFGKKFDNEHSFIPFGKRSITDISFEKPNYYDSGDFSSENVDLLPISSLKDSNNLDPIEYAEQFIRTHGYIPFEKRFDDPYSMMHFDKNIFPSTMEWSADPIISPEDSINEESDHFYESIDDLKANNDRNVQEDISLDQSLDKSKGNDASLDDSTSFTSESEDESLEKQVNQNYSQEVPEFIPQISDSSNRVKRQIDYNVKTKKYLGLPFQGPKSMLYPHAWLAAQLRRSSVPFTLTQGEIPFLRTRSAEKKEVPMNSFIHFG